MIGGGEVLRDARRHEVGVVGVAGFAIVLVGYLAFILIFPFSVLRFFFNKKSPKLIYLTS